MVMYGSRFYFQRVIVPPWHGRFGETEGRHGGPQNSDNSYKASANPLQEEHQRDGAKVQSGR